MYACNMLYILLFNVHDIVDYYAIMAMLIIMRRTIISDISQCGEIVNKIPFNDLGRLFLITECF